MSCNAFFFMIDWNKRNRMGSDFWNVYLDEDGVLKPQHLECICQINDFKDGLEFWKIADEANDIYEFIREQLPAESTRRLDFFISNTFSYDSCTFWKDFDEQDAPEGDWLAQIDFSSCLSPDEIDEILSLWSEEGKAQMKRVYPHIDKPRYLMSAENFIWYVETWISMLKDVRKRQGWGLIWVISY
jgi:hypothetical protein